jgi:alcohol dehydrogenase (cytochrome c)
VSDVRWRVEIIADKALGTIDGIGWVELLGMLRPGSPIYLKGLASNPNPYAVITNPFASDSDRAKGAELFSTRCTTCHGEGGHGQTAPSLIGRGLKFGDADWSLFQSIKYGRLEVGMPPADVTGIEAWQIVGHIRNLRNGRTALEEAGAEHAGLQHVDVPSTRIEHAESEPHNWLTYSGSYFSWRYSALDAINRDNVAALKLAWSLQLDTQAPYTETTPLVIDGIMYLTTTESDVIATDAANGNVLWRYVSGTPTDVPTCCGRVNRGVAVLGDRVFVTTLDNRVVALDARTGTVAWEAQAADYEAGYSMTAAPLAARDKIIVGMAGGDFGTRGFLDAYDAITGERVWRFQTIPEPGEPGSETWGNDAWRTGGGATWVTGSFDRELGLIYWGVGNPAPDFNGDVRPGDNLFTNSIVALDVDTGRLAWHFQFTPHDEHDWDANQVPVLVNREYAGAPRRLMLWGNRNGFYYVLDRETGEFLHASAFVTQNWATGIDAKGRPILRPESEPSAVGTLTWPGLSGGGNWWSPSYSPLANLVYIPFADAPKVFFKNDDFDGTEPIPGEQFHGGASAHTGEPLPAGMRALNPVDGTVAWEYLRPNPQRNRGWIGGVLSTAGGLVFLGDLTDFVAFDAESGAELWRINLGGYINAAPISYSVAGQQHIAIAAGNSIYTFRP